MAKVKATKFDATTSIGKKYGRGDLNAMRNEIMMLRGWTKEQYTKAYDVYKHKVRNYNKITGSSLSPTVQFYYSQKADIKGYEKFDTMKTIESLSSSTGKISSKSEKIALNDFNKRFEKLIDKSPYLKSLKTGYEHGVLSAKEYTEEVRRVALTGKRTLGKDENGKEIENPLYSIEEYSQLGSS